MNPLTSAICAGIMLTTAFLNLKFMLAGETMATIGFSISLWSSIVLFILFADGIMKG